MTSDYEQTQACQQQVTSGPLGYPPIQQAAVGELDNFINSLVRARDLLNKHCSQCHEIADRVFGAPPPKPEPGAKPTPVSNGAIETISQKLAEIGDLLALLEAGLERLSNL